MIDSRNHNYFIPINDTTHYYITTAVKTTTYLLNTNALHNVVL